MWNLWTTAEAAAPDPAAEDKSSAAESYQGDIQELDDDEFDRLSDCSNLEEFAFVSNSDDLKKLQQTIEELSNTNSILEVDLRAKNVQLESSKKLHRQEIEFKDRLVQQKELQMEQTRKDAKKQENKAHAETLKMGEKLELVTKEAEDTAKENRQLTEEVAKLTRSVQEVEQKCASAESSHTLLAKQLSAKTEEATKLKEEVASLQAQLSRQLEEARAQAAAAAAAAEASNLEVVQTPNQRQNVQELARAKQKENDLASENAQLKAELQQSKKLAGSRSEELDRHAIQNNDLKNEKAGLVSQRDQLKKELEQAHTASKKLTKQNEDLQNTIKAQGKEIAQLKEAEREHVAEVKSLQNECRKHLEELEARAIQLAAAKDETVGMKEQLTQVTKEMKKTKDQMEAQAARMERMQQGVDEITRSVDSSNLPQTEITRIQNKYRTEVTRIIKENPNCIPIRCVRSTECSSAYPLLEKKKFAAPKDMTLSRFNEHIRQKLKLSPDQPLSVYVESSIPLPASEALEDIHNLCKGLDGFLHLKYSHVSEQAP